MAAAAEAKKWASVAAEAVAEVEKWTSITAEAGAKKWASVAAKAAAEVEAEKWVPVAANAASEAEKCASVAEKGASEAEKWASIAISAAAKQRSLAVAVVSQDNADIKKGLKEEEGEEELVITNPKLASLIYHGFNIAFVLQVVFFIAHVFIYYNVCGVWWQAFAATAIGSPLLIAPLYVMPLLRDVFVRAYAMAPSDTRSSDLSGKPLLSEEV